MKFFSLIYAGDVHPSDDTKIIPSSEFSTLISAAELVERAKEEASQYQEEVAKECQALREKAASEGFAEGLAQFSKHLLSFEQQMRALQIDIQRQILPLALKAAKKIVGKELETHPETIVDIVIQTLTPVMQNHRFIIYVSKNDKELLETEKQKIRGLLDHVQSLSIHERADLSPGDCIIETDSGIINARLENVWRALEIAFEKYIHTQ